MKLPSLPPRTYCSVSFFIFTVNSYCLSITNLSPILDVGMLTLNQYILLDPILLCFMTASVLGMVKLSKATHCGDNFTRRWWYWLFFTGTMLACTISVKFVGLFVVLLVGLHTINDLWIVLGDLAKPVVSYTQITDTNNSSQKLLNFGSVIFSLNFIVVTICRQNYLRFHNPRKEKFVYAYDDLKLVLCVR